MEVRFSKWQKKGDMNLVLCISTLHNLGHVSDPSTLQQFLIATLLKYLEVFHQELVVVAFFQLTYVAHSQLVIVAQVHLICFYS